MKHANHIRSSWRSQNVTPIWKKHGKVYHVAFWLASKVVLEQELVEPRNADLTYDEVVLKKDRLGKDLLHGRPTFASIPELKQ